MRAEIFEPLGDSWGRMAPLLLLQLEHYSNLACGRQALVEYALTERRCILYRERRGLSQEADCGAWDPASSHDLGERERGAHRDGQRATERREQAAAGHRQAPGPHACHRRLRHPGGGGALPRVCKWQRDMINNLPNPPPRTLLALPCASLQEAVSGENPKPQSPAAVTAHGSRLIQSLIKWGWTPTSRRNVCVWVW